MAVENPTGHVVRADPEPSPGLLELASGPDLVAPHSESVHDYVVAADRFGGTLPLARRRGPGRRRRLRPALRPHAGLLDRPAEPDRRDRRSRRLPGQRLSQWVHLHPDRPKRGQLNTGVNGYESEFSHDVVGILTNLFTQGYFTGRPRPPARAQQRGRVAGPIRGRCLDLPGALGRLSAEDRRSRIRTSQHFASEGPRVRAQPSIEDTAHQLAADRTGPLGTMEATDDIDTQGYWTTDDYEALLGLAAYRYLASAVGDATEAAWASREYDQLLTATDTRAGRDHPPVRTRLPALLDPPTQHGQPVRQPRRRQLDVPIRELGLGGLPVRGHARGPGISLIDATYDYGFSRLRGLLPPNTTGGFPDDFYASAYNAAQGSAGLASQHHRDQGILNYQFMIANSQSGPMSWWESSTRTLTDDPLGRKASRSRPRIVAPCLGNCGRQQGPPRLTGRPAVRWRAHRRAWGARQLAG